MGWGEGERQILGGRLRGEWTVALGWVLVVRPSKSIWSLYLGILHSLGCVTGEKRRRGYVFLAGNKLFSPSKMSSGKGVVQGRHDDRNRSCQNYVGPLNLPGPTTYLNNNHKIFKTQNCIPVPRSCQNVSDPSISSSRLLFLAQKEMGSYKFTGFRSR